MKLIIKYVIIEQERNKKINLKENIIYVTKTTRI
jgi:hypothetical protein